MPKAKYNTQEIKGELYYIHDEPTGLRTPDGKVEYKRFRAKTQKRMDEKLEEYRRNKQTINRNTVTVKVWFDKWIEVYKAQKSENTRQNYTYLFKHIEPSIGNILLNNVKPIQCQEILNNLANDHSIATVKRVRTVMHDLFEKAKQNGLVDVNPAERLEANGNAEKQRRELTEDERKKYLECCKNHPFGQQASFLYWFGLRRGEMIALDADDIADEDIKINKQLIYPDNNLPIEAPPKTESGERVIPIPDSAKEYIDFDTLRSSKGRLFTMPDGRDTTYSALRNGWRRFIREALGPDTDITMHCVRHNYCTMLIEHDVNVLAAKELMGHNDIETTIKIYSHYSERIQKTATDKVKSL